MWGKKIFLSNCFLKKNDKKTSGVNTQLNWKLILTSVCLFPVDLYEYYLICIFMIIHENLKNEGKSRKNYRPMGGVGVRYANDIIFIYDHWINGLVKMYHWLY